MPVVVHSRVWTQPLQQRQQSARCQSQHQDHGHGNDNEAGLFETANPGQRLGCENERYGRDHRPPKWCRRPPISTIDNASDRVPNPKTSGEATRR